MTAEAAGTTGWPASTRRRLLNAAMVLFGQYSFAGTSLQMIADELGLTKAAIYYHFRTREQLLLALMDPILEEIGAAVEAAGERNGPAARAEAMLAGYAAVVAKNRAVAAITIFDPGVRAVLRNHPEWSAAIDRQLALLAGTQTSVAGSINAMVTLTGLAGAAASAPHGLDDETLCAHLFDVGRRTLGL